MCTEHTRLSTSWKPGCFDAAGNKQHLMGHADGPARDTNVLPEVLIGCYAGKLCEAGQFREGGAPGGMWNLVSFKNSTDC